MNETNETIVGQSYVTPKDTTIEQGTTEPGGSAAGNVAIAAVLVAFGAAAVELVRWIVGLF